MSDPRELLDAYAEEIDFERGDLADDREHEAPKAFAALRAVLDLHRAIRWGEVTGVCAECTQIATMSYGSDTFALLPCLTVAAITTALEAT